jgi:hypothetical protein
MFHQTGASSMTFSAVSMLLLDEPAVQIGRRACAVFGGRFAPGSGLLSSPISSALGFVGCTRSRTQTVAPKFRALVKHPG